MISLRTLLTSLVTAAITGGVGLVSGLYLEQRASQQRLAEMEHLHQLELERINYLARGEQAHAQDLLSQGLYQAWMAEPLVTQSRIARELLDRFPAQNYAAIIGREDVTPEQREALRAVVRFWMRIDDLAQDQLLNIGRVTGLLGADSLGWAPYMEALTRGLENNAQNGAAFYAQSGVNRLAERQMQQNRLARAQGTPERGPRLPRCPGADSRC